MIKLTIIEGASEEVLAVAKGLGAEEAVAPTDLSSELIAGAKSEERLFVTTEFARKVINRRPLSVEQTAIFVALAKASPEWVPAADLQAATEYSPAQFAGAMGALGRRLSHTEGYVDDSWLFDTEWDYDVGAYRYRLPDSVLEALKIERIVA